MKFCLVPCLVAFALVGSAHLFAQKDPCLIVPLLDNWQVNELGSDLKIPAEVPGSIFLDLMRSGIIEDPFYRDNEKHCQWVEEKDWAYSLAFDVEKEVMEKERVELLFKGLDTYANVYLNDSLILKANNMFRSWQVDVRSLLNETQNELSVVFRSIINEHLYDLKDASSPLPAPSDASLTPVSPYARKAPYHFGWDWGPRLAGCGIWAPVELIAFDGSVLRNVSVKTDLRSAEIANVKLNLVLDASCKEEVIVKTELGEVKDSSNFELSVGLNEIDLNLEMADPKLWWPVGFGTQHLYDLEIQIDGAHTSIHHKGKVGIREVELLQEEDRIGREFTFRINGQRIFMKGANMVPMSMFPSDIDRSETEHLLDEALAANMNMIRVWGGGLYGSDDLYELCDEKGIMVWQDFMFACSMYPGTIEFQENVRQEVTEQINRISRHPSLVMWCGNNEVDVAWNNWGWQEQYGIGPADSTKIWTDSKFLFDQLIPDLLELHDPNTPYIPSSPQSNWGKPENFNFGNMHYWGVWHGEAPIEGFAGNVGRFMSEYGMQSFPNWNSIEGYTIPEDRELGSPVFNHHQKSYKGDGLIMEMVDERYGTPRNTNSLVHLSQILQAEAMTIAIDAHRMKVPHCMGSLYWQLNDVWPGPSWSTIDHSGNWKAAHYHVQKAFRPSVVLYELDNDSLKIYVHNDHSQEIDAYIEVFHHLPSGKAQNQMSFPISLTQVGLQKVAHLDLVEMFGKHSFRKAPLILQLNANGEPMDRAIIFNGEKKQKRSAIGPVIMEVDRTKAGWKLTINSERTVPWVVLEATRTGHFSDNYFSLLNGEEKVIQFTVSEEIQEDEVEFELKTLGDLTK